MVIQVLYPLAKTLGAKSVSESTFGFREVVVRVLYGKRCPSRGKVSGQHSTAEQNAHRHSVHPSTLLSLS